MFFKTSIYGFWFNKVQLIGNRQTKNEGNGLHMEHLTNDVGGWIPSTWYSRTSNLVDVWDRLHTFTYDMRYLFPFFFAFGIFWEVFFWYARHELKSKKDKRNKARNLHGPPAALHRTSWFLTITLPSILTHCPPSWFLTRLRPYQIFLSDSSLEVLTITCSSIYSDFAYVWFFLCQIFKVVGLHVGWCRILIHRHNIKVCHSLR